MIETDALVKLYPALAKVAPAPGELNARGGAFLQVPAATPLFETGMACQGFPLVMTGEIKVFRSSPDGRSLELYRVSPGELCLVSCASLFRHQEMSARGVTTQPTTLCLIPPPVFDQWLEEPSFRQEVLGLFAERMADLTALVDAVAFRRLDQRLATALLGRGQSIAITHQALADELGTVREIVTRLLRRFEREGWIELAREQVRIVDGAALRSVAERGGNSVT